MKKRIKLPFLLNSNIYLGVVVFITLVWAFSETVRNAEGFGVVVMIICVLMVLNGLANTLLEKIDYPNTYQIKDKEKIIGVSNNNGANYIALFIALIISRFWLTAQGPIGDIIYLIIIVPLFAAVCLVLLELVKSMLSNGFELSSSIIGFAFLFYMLGSWTKITIANTYGEEKIGSFFEKSEYTTKYYVNLFPDEESAKNYRLPADIHVYYEDHEGDETSTSEKCIRIERAYFPNGGYVSFSDNGDDEENLRFGKKVDLTDSSGKDWYVELVDEKVK